jgi:ABC-type multidrug transport system ATPase subunit
VNVGPLWELREVVLGRRLRGVSLAIGRGVTAVLGHSGAGKTSLLNVLVGFEAPDAGVCEGPMVSGAWRRPVFWAPQDDGLWPHLTVREHLALLDAGRATGLLEDFDLAGRAGVLPRVLSRGERARLAVARALAADAAVLVMDEPLAHVDPARAGRYWTVIRQHIERQGASLVFATHAPAAVLGEAGNVICLKDGTVQYAGGVEALYRTPATSELAGCLGEANWLEAADARLWLQAERVAPWCLRPEQVCVVPAEDGLFTVVMARFRGSVAEVRLSHSVGGVERTFWHRPAGDHLRAGMRVRLDAV